MIGASPASCALLRAAVGPDSTPVGRVRATAAGAEGGEPDAGAPLFAAAPGVLVCCCDGAAAVPPQRAPAWARGVLSALQPARLLVLGSIQVRRPAAAMLTRLGRWPAGGAALGVRAQPA